jgi:hypothetical protein
MMAGLWLCGASSYAQSTPPRAARPAGKTAPRVTVAADAGLPYVEAGNITTTGNGPNLVPTLSGLTGPQEADLLADVAHLPAFPAYPYSGCDDRAHALYLLLPKWQPSLAKVWIFSGAVLSPAFAGGIRYAPPSGAAPTSWDYHVAVAYRQRVGGQLMVLDLALAPSPRPLPIQQWLAKFQISPGSVWTLLPGNLYSFNKTESCNYAKGRQFFNGNMFAYEGPSKAENRIPNNLARDAAGALALKQNDCPEIGALVKQPGDLLAFLQKAPADNNGNATCRAYVTAYQQALAEWAKRF